MAKVSLRSNLTDEEIRKRKREHLIESVDVWTAFFRKNPHRFAEFFLNIKLKTYQKILLYEMAINSTFCFVGSRGIAKSWIIAVYAVIRAILYPGEQICIVSKTLGQATGVLKKITDDLMLKHGYGSDLLRNEISDDKSKGKDPYIEFKNGSKIFVAVATDNARGFRSTINVYDEFVILNMDIINSVHDKFLTAPRSPQYLNDPRYADLEENNSRIYLSSPLYKDTKAFNIQIDTLKKMLKDKDAFTCSIPYQCGIKEHIILRSTIRNELESDDYDPVTFSMEYGALWYGSTGEEFFSYDDISKQRVLVKSFPHLDLVMSGKEKVELPDYRCVRVLAVDIALMASTKKKNNDASAFTICDGVITSDDKYIANYRLFDSKEGLLSNELGIMIMRYFYKYHCTHIVVDSNGIGMPIVDFIMQDQTDPLTSELYPALNCINDKDMQDRCRNKEAKKVIWSFKANASLNSSMAKMLRNGFRQGNINLLVHDYDAKDELMKDSKYQNASLSTQLKYELPYIDTTLAVNELIKLDYDVSGSNIKIKEKFGMRKDRYSSLAMNYFLLKELERNIKQPSVNNEILLSLSRKPKKSISVLH